MKLNNMNASRKSTAISSREYKRIMENLRKSHSEGACWGYFLQDTKPELLHRIEDTLTELKNKHVHYLTMHICGSIVAPLSMAVATFACTLSNIKRIYICESPEFISTMRKISKHENAPLITRRAKNLIPYEVLRILGKGKVLFVKYNNLRKFELFVEDDLKAHKFCRYFPVNIAGQDRALGKDYQKYKAEWLSDDEVVIR